MIRMRGDDGNAILFGKSNRLHHGTNTSLEFDLLRLSAEMHCAEVSGTMEVGLLKIDRCP